MRIAVFSRMSKGPKADPPDQERSIGLRRPAFAIGCVVLAVLVMLIVLLGGYWG